jgi:hypothetical protein
MLIDRNQDLLLRSELFEDIFLRVFRALKCLTEGLGCSDPAEDGFCIFDELEFDQCFQAELDQTAGVLERLSVDVEQGYLKTSPSENDGPTAANQPATDDGNLSIHWCPFAVRTVNTFKLQLFTALRRPRSTRGLSRLTVGLFTSSDVKAGAFTYAQNLPGLGDDRGVIRSWSPVWQNLGILESDPRLKLAFTRFF